MRIKTNSTKIIANKVKSEIKILFAMYFDILFYRCVFKDARNSGDVKINSADVVGN